MSSSLFHYDAEASRSRKLHSAHFLEACAMCRKPLGLDRDIYMYQGITAFCSDECREERIEMEGRPWRPKKVGWNLSGSLRALRRVIPAAARSWRPSSSVATA